MRVVSRTQQNTGITQNSPAQSIKYEYENSPNIIDSLAKWICHNFAFFGSRLRLFSTTFASFCKRDEFFFTNFPTFHVFLSVRRRNFIALHNSIFTLKSVVLDRLSSRSLQVLSKL